MKKLFAVLLALVLCFSGCSQKNEETPKEENSVNNEEINGSSEEVHEEVLLDFVPERGKAENGVYKNESFGIGFSGGEDWYYFTDEEIAQTYGIAAEEFLSEEFNESLAEAPIIYDMYAANVLSGCTVNIIYENIGDMSAEYYAEVSKVQLENQLYGSEMELLRNETGTIKIGEKEAPCLFAALGISGTEIYEIIVFDKTGDWVAIMTVASQDENEVKTVAENLIIE